MTKLLRLLHQKISNKQWLRRELIFLAIILAVISMCLLPIRHVGWPQNHEGLAFVDRTAIYSDHLRHGDLFPIWSSSDAFGMGTPLPLFYHKTFYIVSSALYLITESMKWSIALAIVVFMLVGAYGMRWSARRLTSRRAITIGVPVAFLLSSYVFTDWLIRGAMAEFSAMMLIPWLIWWCLALLQDKRFSLWIVPIFFLLFNAHNVTALYATLPALLACGLFVLYERGAGIKRVWKRAFISAGLLVALFAPQLVLQRLFLGEYNPGKITQAGFQASENFHNPGTYFINPNYTWLADWRTYTVQIDFAIWMVLALLLAGLAIWGAYRRRVVLHWVRTNILTAPGIFLALSALIMFLFQCRLTKPLYEHVRVLQYLQFPWRLLAFITPLAILLIAYIVSRYNGGWPLRAFVAGWLALFLAFSPLPHHFQYAFIAPSVINDIPVPHTGGIGGSITGIGEYLPRVTRDGREMKSLEVLTLYQQLYEETRQTETLSGSCIVQRRPQRSFDSLTVTLHASCSRRSEVALPVSYNGYSQVMLTTTKGQIRLDCMRHSDDPRIIVDLPQGDNMTVEVKLPTVGHVLAKLL